MPTSDEISGESGVAISPLVYLVDDDEDFREEMIWSLSRQGLNVVGFDGAASLYRAFAVRPSDIVVLDIGLDGEDGFSMAAHLRASRSVGIVLATARGSVDDRINGLQAGADAYFVKPVDARELAAMIVALGDRLNGLRALSTLSQPSGPGWGLEESGWVLSDGLGHRLRLTTAEQHLLRRLFAERGQPVDRRALVEAFGEDIYDYNYAHLDTIVSRLRRRAGKSGVTLPLHAVRGIGFVFAN